jgi:tagaturonate reductase
LHSITLHMILTKYILDNIDNENVIIPDSTSLNLPERVLQFGTGVLLRGLPDYFIDKANRQGIFNGRVVVVKSTGKGDLKDFRDQDNLYTICIRGIENGQNIEQNIVSSAISRVLSADSEWENILGVARNPDVRIYISNTTEVGIVLIKESIFQTPPLSFPAKLLAALYARYQAKVDEQHADIVVIATELIPDNGKKLATIVTELIDYNKLEQEFVSWFQKHVQFCNSLVDRIVPGKPDNTMLKTIQEGLGYEDNLLIMAEPYRLWAIEGDAKVSRMLELEDADSGVIVKDDIEIYRELKVRLLNGSHTLASGIAYLSGIETVADAMANDKLSDYITNLMQQEIIPAIPYNIQGNEAIDFSASVLDRFANPYIEHLWINITFQYTMKLRIRILPVLMRYYQLSGKVPAYIAAGFAAYLRFMRIDEKKDDKYYGSFNGKTYPIADESAEYFLNKSEIADSDYVRTVLSDIEFWGENLSKLNGFIDEVDKNYRYISENQMISTPA